MNSTKSPIEDSELETDATKLNESVDIALYDLLDLARRRWWLLLFTVVIAVGFAWWRTSGRVDRYTAQVVLQQKTEAALLGNSLLSSASDNTATQIEVLRSRAVLDGVVAATALRAVLLDPALRRSGVFEHLMVAKDAPQSSYLVRQTGEQIELLDADSRKVLASARVGQSVTYAGLSFIVAKEAGRAEPLRIGVLSRDDAANALRGNLRIEAVKGTPMIRIRYSNSDPVLAADVANAMAVAYQDYSAWSARQTATRRREYIAKQLSQVADSLVAAQRVLTDYQAGSRMLNPQVEGTAVANALLSAEGELRNLRFQETNLQDVVRSLQTAGESSLAVRRIVALGRDLIPNGLELYNKLQSLEAERSRQTSSRFGYVRDAPNIEVVDSQIVVARKEVRDIAEQALSLLHLRIKATEARIVDLRGQVGAVPAQATEFSRLDQRVAAIMRTFDLLAEKYYEAQIAEAVESGNVDVLDAAVIPKAPDPSNTPRALLIAAIVGLLLGGVIAYGLERVDSSIRNASDAERSSGLDVIAQIPRLKKQKGDTAPGLIVATDEHSLGAEAFRVLRTALRFVRSDRPQVIAVTSAAPGEGKSMIAANAAIALGQEGLRVLLIDADMRRPMVHRLFTVPSVPGLSDLLTSDVLISAAIRTDPGYGISVLPCGTSTNAPAELLGSPAFSKIISELRQQYDAIVIDTPPVLAVTDASVITPAVDGVLVVLRARQTNRFGFSHAVRQLRKVGAPLLGVLMNAVPHVNGYGRYGGYYGYHGYYYYTSDYTSPGGSKSKRRGLSRVWRLSFV